MRVFCQMKSCFLLSRKLNSIHLSKRNILLEKTCHATCFIVHFSLRTQLVIVLPRKLPRTILKVSLHWPRESLMFRPTSSLLSFHSTSNAHSNPSSKKIIGSNKNFDFSCNKIILEKTSVRRKTSSFSSLTL